MADTTLEEVYHPFVLADPIGWQEWLQPAKTAESGQKLPKWQALANLMPNNAIANAMPNKIFFAWIFFI